MTRATHNLLKVPSMDAYDETNPIEVPWGSYVEVPSPDKGGKTEILEAPDFMREMGKAAVTSIDGNEYFVDEDFTLRPWWTGAANEGEI